MEREGERDQAEWTAIDDEGAIDEAMVEWIGGCTPMFERIRIHIGMEAMVALAHDEPEA